MSPSKPTRDELVGAIAECVRRGLLSEGSTPERLIVPPAVLAEAAGLVAQASPRKRGPSRVRRS